jgi:hypothetical protein
LAEGLSGAIRSALSFSLDVRLREVAGLNTLANLGLRSTKENEIQIFAQTISIDRHLE